MKNPTIKDIFAGRSKKRGRIENPVRAISKSEKVFDKKQKTPGGHLNVSTRDRNIAQMKHLRAQAEARSAHKMLASAMVDPEVKPVIDRLAMLNLGGAGAAAGAGGGAGGGAGAGAGAYTPYASPAASPQNPSPASRLSHSPHAPAAGAGFGAGAGAAAAAIAPTPILRRITADTNAKLLDETSTVDINFADSDDGLLSDHDLPGTGAAHFSAQPKAMCAAATAAALKPAAKPATPVGVAPPTPPRAQATSNKVGVTATFAS